MSLDEMAGCLAELGHPTRLQILRYLVKSGHAGAAVGDIQEALGIPGSTLSHHLSRMVKVGLVEQVRESRTLHCFPRFEVIESIANFLMEECCVNEACAIDTDDDTSTAR
nr:metalloregulator ArsR/SmtB family transcription factor [Saccharospirillum salsuginis]